LEAIKIERRDGIAHVTLNRPSVKNAVTLAMWRGLFEIFTRLAGDRDVRAVVLNGEGKDFSVGADITEFDTARNDNARASITRLRSMPVPVRSRRSKSRSWPPFPAIALVAAVISRWPATFASPIEPPQ